MALRFFSFWSINASITPARLRAELERFAEHGLDGVVFHPRYYPGAPDYLSPDYLAVVSDAILAARDLGLAFWIYDENGWPSGTADGAMLRRHPHLAQQWLGLFPGPGPDPTLRVDRNGGVAHLEVRTGPGVDYLSDELGERFVELTHERYQRGLAPAAFDHVEAFFCDEPEFGTAYAMEERRPEAAVPWTGRLEAAFAERHQVALRPLLPALFVDRPHAAEVRRAFWELTSDLFADGFCAPIDAWCTRHGKRFTAHLKGEESLLFQVFTSGAAETAFHRIGLPGVDALERLPGNDYYPRQASTASRQFSDGRTMAEAFGGSGWGAGPADLEAYVHWLSGHGVTDVVLHLSQLRLDSPALFDWPPSQPFHLTWARVYRTLLDRLRVEAPTRPAADTLLVSPHRAVMESVQAWELRETNIHNAATHPDTPAGRVSDRFAALVEQVHAAGVAYDVVAERTVEEHAAIGPDVVRIGAQSYRHVLVSPEARLDPPTRDALLASGVLREPTSYDTVAPRTAPSCQTAAAPAPDDPPAWTPIGSAVNELPLTAAPRDGWCRTSFTSAFSAPTRVTLVFADDVADLRVAHSDSAPDLTAAVPGARPLAATLGRDGSVATLEVPAGRVVTTLVFHVRHTARLAFAWVRGEFLVRSQTALVAADRPDQVVTDGPFVLTDPGSALDGADLLVSGFPFRREPLRAWTRLTLRRPARRILLTGHAADAVRVRCADAASGWQWGHEVGLDGTFSVGEHTVEVELVPNSFNVYGPHHYLRGDAPAISPGQVAGLRNFLDPDLPPKTHEHRWHLRRFALPTVVASRP